MKLLTYIQSAFTRPIDFKSKIGRCEFFIGIIVSSIFLVFNIYAFISIATYSQSDLWMYFNIPFILIAFLFAFVQIHSLLARRLNDIKVNPYFAFLPFLLGSIYIALRTLFHVNLYGKLIFIVILIIILIYVTLIVSESDK
jgi:uncharacterized membrane protein YhaH (DUF805 family)